MVPAKVLGGQGGQEGQEDLVGLVGLVEDLDVTGEAQTAKVHGEAPTTDLIATGLHDRTGATGRGPLGGAEASVHLQTGLDGLQDPGVRLRRGRAGRRVQLVLRPLASSRRQ
jgi:hypothetical protein